MTSTAEDEKQFVFVFPPPTATRVILFTFSAVFLAAGLVLVFGLLLNNAPAPTVDYSIWALVLGLAAGIAFFMRLAFPSLASSAKLEIEPGRIRFTPIRMLRMIGEQSVEVLIPPHSTEILLCRSIHPGLSHESRIIVHGPAGEAGIKVDYLVILSSQNLERLADGLTAATGLPVRMIIRRIPDDGMTEEMPWILPQGAARWISALGFVLVVLPYTGGIIEGWIRPAPAVIAAVGFALWLLSLLGARLVARRDPAHPAFPTASFLMTVFTFGATYAFSVVITIFMFHSH
jgi:type IV secretory pathway TrbD component